MDRKSEFYNFAFYNFTFYNSVFYNASFHTSAIYDKIVTKWFLALMFFFSVQVLPSPPAESKQTAPDTGTFEPGRPLPHWQEGEFDIHHINTGRGDATFFIFPDGTTMLFDAGDHADGARPEGYIPPRIPDASRPAGEWIARYIKARHPDRVHAALDYILISHFHGDHMNALGDVAEFIPVRTLLDRSGPGGYDELPRSETIQRYLQIVEQQVELGNKVEKFQPGHDDQIVLQNSPMRFPQFKLRNLAANAEVWTGSGTETRPRFPDDEEFSAGYLHENMLSTAFVIRYGKFAYYAGGDLQEPVEKATAWVTGPVDVHNANHHGSQAHPFFLSVVRPRVHIIQVWAVIQPRPHVFERLYDESIYPGPRDVFLTNGLWDGRAEHFLERYEERVAQLIDNYTVETGEKYVNDYMNRVAADQGHVVVRVEPGGGHYRVIVLDDSDENFTIKSVHGPYESR